MQAQLYKIDELMKQKRWDEAEGMLKQVFSSEMLHDEERGQAFITYTMAYLEALTAVNLEYKAALEDAVLLIRSMKQAQSEVNEDIDLQRLHAEIDTLSN